MNVRVKIDAALTKRLLESEDGPTFKQLLKFAVRAETWAKRFAPVDTGRLRSSITHRIGKDSQGPYAEIGTDVDYAIYQELGTRDIWPVAFLRRGIEAVRKGDTG